MSHISEFSKCPKCPKCRKQFLKKSSSHTPGFGKEYFCHKCHVYFGIIELVYVWGYDAADLYSDELVETPKEFILFEDWKSDTVSDLYEGEWYSACQREDSYEVVNEMLQGVDAWDNYDDYEDYDVYADLMQTQEYALQRGLQ